MTQYLVGGSFEAVVPLNSTNDRRETQFRLATLDAVCKSAARYYAFRLIEPLVRDKYNNKPIKSLKIRTFAEPLSKYPSFAKKPKPATAKLIGKLLEKEPVFAECVNFGLGAVYVSHQAEIEILDKQAEDNSKPAEEKTQEV